MQHFCMWTSLPYLHVFPALSMKMQYHRRGPQNSYSLHAKACWIQSRATWVKINKDPHLWTSLLWTSLPLFYLCIPNSTNLDSTSLATSLLLFLHVQNQITPIAELRSIAKHSLFPSNVYFNKRIYRTKWVICNFLQMECYGTIFWIFVLPKSGIKMG